MAARDQIEAALTVADQTALDELLAQTHGAVDPGAVWQPYLLLVLVQDHRPVDRDRLLFLLRWWWFDQLDREARARVARKWSRLRVAVPTEVVALARSASSTTTPPAPGERPALARLQELLAARHDLAAVHQEQREAAAIATERRRAVVAEVLAQADRATQIEDDETATEELFAKLRRDHENELVTGPATEDLGLVDLSARERLRALVPDGKGDRPVPLVAVDSELETAIRTAYLDALREARGGDLP